MFHATTFRSQSALSRSAAGSEPPAFQRVSADGSCLRSRFRGGDQLTGPEGAARCCGDSGSSNSFQPDHYSDLRHGRLLVLRSRSRAAQLNCFTLLLMSGACSSACQSACPNYALARRRRQRFCSGVRHSSGGPSDHGSGLGIELDQKVSPIVQLRSFV